MSLIGPEPVADGEYEDNHERQRTSTHWASQSSTTPRWRLPSRSHLSDTTARRVTPRRASHKGTIPTMPNEQSRKRQKTGISRN